VQKGTRAGANGEEIKVVTPIIGKTKDEILRKGTELGVPFEYTWSCYEGREVPCGECESCIFRKKAFEEVGLKDPLI